MHFLCMCDVGERGGTESGWEWGGTMMGRWEDFFQKLKDRVTFYLQVDEAWNRDGSDRGKENLQIGLIQQRQ